MASPVVLESVKSGAGSFTVTARACPGTSSPPARSTINGRYPMPFPPMILLLSHRFEVLGNQATPFIPCLPSFVAKPNAGAHLLPEAGATQEHRLEAVRCSAWFGAGLPR